MAISQQFSSILKNHPELAKAQETQKAELTVSAKGKINPFRNLKQTAVDTTVQPETVVPSAGVPFKKIKAVVVVDEDNNDDDPALVAVADKPFEDKANEDITVKAAAKEKKAKAEATKREEPTKEVKPEESVKEDKSVKKEETKIKQEETKSKEPKKEQKAAETTNNLVDIMSEEDKDPGYFKGHINLLQQRYIDEEFDRYQEDITKRLEGIKITSDLNTGTVKVRLADISTLRQEIFKHRVNIKMLLQCPLDKEHGDIYASAKVQVRGSNESERKSAYFQYLKNFPMKNGTVDVPFLTTILDMYNIFFESVLAELKAKQDALAIYTGNLKIDAQIS